MILSYSMIFAQSNPKLSNYEFAPLTYNPAYAGANDGFIFSSVYSTQWLGFDGAPNTIFLTTHGMINSKVGIGLNIVSDHIGATKESKIIGNFSYRINLNKDLILAMGVKSGLATYNIDYNMLNIENSEEISVFSQNNNTINFNFGTGIYLYSDNYFLGVSVPNILTSKYLDTYNETQSKTTRHYFLTTGYSYNFMSGITFQPTLLMRIAKGAPISTLINFNLNWKNKYFTSFNIDPNTSIGGYVGFKILEKHIIGYSYESSINKFTNYNNGNHAIFLKLKFDNFLNRNCSCSIFN